MTPNLLATETRRHSAAEPQPKDGERSHGDTEDTEDELVQSQPTHASVGSGFWLGTASLGLADSPSIGMTNDRSESFSVSLCLCGCPLIVGQPLARNTT